MFSFAETFWTTIGFMSQSWNTFEFSGWLFDYRIFLTIHVSSFNKLSISSIDLKTPSTLHWVRLIMVCKHIRNVNLRVWHVQNITYGHETEYDSSMMLRFEVGDHLQTYSSMNCMYPRGAVREGFCVLLAYCILVPNSSILVNTEITTDLRKNNTPENIIMKTDQIIKPMTSRYICLKTPHLAALPLESR